MFANKPLRSPAARRAPVPTPFGEDDRMSETPAVPSATADDTLHRLMTRVGFGDRAAFRSLYAFLAVQVWRTAARALPERRDAEAVTHATFLQVWHCSPGAGSFDVRGWVAAIVAARIRDRLRREPSSRPVRRHLHDLLTH